jgi:long-chain-fatty-acid--CoA ligase ACSBG
VWEKFEEKLKEAALLNKSAILRYLVTWAKELAFKRVESLRKQEAPPLLYPVFNSMLLLKIKAALGLDETQIHLFGAAPMKSTSIEYFASLDMPLFNMYGMSETTGATTCHSIENFRLDTAGFAMPGTDLKIHNPDEDGEGEICMRGRNTMMGYLKNDKATQETIDEQGFIRSGDRGKIEKDGHLRITGRIKELIIGAGGENIAPVPIEDRFKAICLPCSNIIVVGEMQRFMAALITFKVDVDMKSGLPSKELTSEAKNFFKNELKLNITTS